MEKQLILQQSIGFMKSNIRKEFMRIVNTYVVVFAQGLMDHAFEMYVHVIEMSPTAF